MIQVWLKMARLARRSGLSNLARFALERLLETREDHVFALRTLRDVLLEIGDAAAVREVHTVPSVHEGYVEVVTFSIATGFLPATVY